MIKCYSCIFVLQGVDGAYCSFVNGLPFKINKEAHKEGFPINCPLPKKERNF